MRREVVSPRRGWQELVSGQGLTFHSPEGRTYWDESVCYRFDSKEIDESSGSRTNCRSSV